MNWGWFILLVLLFLMYISVKGNGAQKRVVYFSKTGCNYCELFQPTWNRLEKAYQGSRIFLSQSKDNGQSWGVKGYPTIRLYQGDIFVAEFTGQRSFETIKEFLDKHDFK